MNVTIRLTPGTPVVALGADGEAVTPWTKVRPDGTVCWRPSESVMAHAFLAHLGPNDYHRIALVIPVSLYGGRKVSMVMSG